MPFCVFIQEKIAYSNFKDLSANKIINTSCTQGQSISFCFFFFLVCVLIVESAVSFATSHPAGFVNFCRAGQGLLFAGRGAPEASRVGDPGKNAVYVFDVFDVFGIC